MTKNNNDESKFPDIKPHKAIVIGLQGSGKTYFSNMLIDRRAYRVFVYTHNAIEFEKMNDNFLIADAKKWTIEQFSETAIQLAKEGAIDGVFFPEFDFNVSNNFEITPHLNDMMITHRHYDMFVLINTRRPQDIPAKIFESSKYVVCFSMDGENAKKKLNGYFKGLGDDVANLKYGSWEAYIKEIGELPVLHNYSQ